MKSTIHPTWYNDAKVTCGCGNTFTTGSTVPELTVDICSKCHPFFTGEMRFVDRQGRVDKFMQKMQKAQAQQDKRAKKGTQPKEDPRSYQEILKSQQAQLKAQSKAKAA